MNQAELSPLIDGPGHALLDRMRTSPSAPLFNHTAGDRLIDEDLSYLENLRTDLNHPSPTTSPSSELLARVEKWLRTVPLFRKNIGRRNDIEGDWHTLPTTSREDVATHPELLVPDDQDIKRLIIFRTSGTTGHPLLVSHHPRAVAAYQVLIQAALKRCNISACFEPGRVACFLIGAQNKTVTYPTVLTAWNQAGFAKLNLNPQEWRKPEDRQAYFREFPPEILTGDPISFASLAELDIDLKPKALISTAVAMSPFLKEKLELRFNAPVIDWYSLTETGPIGFMRPSEEGYSLLPNDIFIEVLDESGLPVKEGEVGEITVSGGRNPYIPLLRYRTGDYGCRRGHALYQLEGRKPVVFMSAKRKRINSVDIARILREHPIVQHHFKQNSDSSCEVTVRPLLLQTPFDGERLAGEIRDLFEGVPVSVQIDLDLGDRIPGGKVTPYISEMKYEE